MKKSQITKDRERRELEEMVDTIKEKTADLVTFLWKLAATIIGLSVVGLGIYAVSLGIPQEIIRKTALIVSGSSAVVLGLAALYYALMYVGKEK